MTSIKDIFIIGKGPSSSHTIGPFKACDYILDKYKDFDKVEVILYGSLALTACGHGSERIILEKFNNFNCKVKTDIDTKVDHPNTMDFIIYEGKEIFKERVISIGGGSILTSDSKPDKDIYPHKNLTEILRYCKENELSLYEYVKKYEDKDIEDYLRNVLKIMVQSSLKGIERDGILPGKLNVPRKAKILYDKAIRRGVNNEDYLVMAAAFGAAEENASGELVCTAPTCGSCGVVPGVIKFLKIRNYDDNKIIEALCVAGLIGKIIKTNATISGAVGGCQAEIGSAAAMGAAMVTYCFNGGNVKIAQAGEIAIEHSLGLTCDPIGGYVQIPCIERNAIYAVKAITSAKLSLLIEPALEKITFDSAVKTMYETGLDMKKEYKETSMKGLSLLEIC